MKFSKSLKLMLSRSLFCIGLFGFIGFIGSNSRVYAQATSTQNTTQGTTQNTATANSVSGVAGGQAGRGWIDNGIPQAYKECVKNNGVNSFCYTAHVDVGSEANLITQIMPVAGISYSLGETDQKYIADLYEGSAIGGIGKGIAYMYTNPPADLALWVRDTGETLGFLPKSVHAQGVGFTGLNALLPVWRGFRNIAYTLVALMMVVIGFMVMFRKKIDPKTVVTVQNALPRIVVVLLLITFSYAIVGLMIDLMYLAIGLGITLLNTALPTGAKISLFGQTADLVNGGFFTLLGSVFAPVINTTGVTQILGGIQTGTQTGNWQSAANAVPGLLAWAGTGFAPGILLWLIIALAYLFGFIRILFMLLMAYVNIIMSVLVGPIQILLDALPGSNSFVSWLKNLFINLVPFPITIFMLILGNALSNSLGTNALWSPPLLPQFGIGAASTFATTILWLGIILSIPAIVNGIKEAAKTKAAIPAGVGTVVGPIMSGGMQALQIGYQLKFLKGGEGRGGPAGTTPVGRFTESAKGPK